MTRRIHTEVLIDASPSAVWKVLIDFPAHAAWNPFLVRMVMAGKPSAGERLHVTFKNGMTMKPTLTEVSEGRVLEWLGKLGISGIFDGRHRFELVPEGSKTRFIQSEQFSGLLIPLLGGLLNKTERDFASLNQALKKRVEEAS